MRATLLTVATLLGIGVLLGRLLQVQVLDRDRYAVYAATQGVADVEFAGTRGAILDRDYSVLAMSDERPTVYGDPRLVDDPFAAAAALAGVLDVDETLVAKRLASDRHFVYVARQVTPEEGRAVESLGLAGVSLLHEASRMRPNGTDLASGVLGAVDIDQNALAGAEKQFTEELTGGAGRRVATVSRAGIPLPAGTAFSRPATPGDDIVLSLHTEIQWIAEQALLRAVDELGAKGGSVVVMGVADGDLLAVAGVVRDPETGEVSVAAHNVAYTDVFEPGSVAKPFTVAAALQEGVASPGELIESPATYVYADKTFREPYRSVDAVLTPEQILVTSSNIGAIKLATRMSGATLHGYLSAFGFGRYSGPGHEAAVPGESRGILDPSSEWHGTRQATMAFGHGVAVTAVQLAAGFNVFANDGEYVAPRLLLGTVDDDGEFEPAPGAEPERVVSEQTARHLRRMLTSVVTDGTGRRAAVPGFAVAGKTGTAQKISADGTYSGAHTSSFAGFLPAGDPVLTVAVVLDEPVEEYLAGLVAAPLFSEIADYALRVLRVAPAES
ncbi:MAG TPA: hypothetical protein DEP66_05870 [Acidimicrobiaceae bacterium]|nr:hypothetical protein [Acidimicrobiaceae bacterium]